MLKRYLSVFTLLLGVTISVYAVPPPEFETVLLPVSTLAPVPGAYGSLWKTEFTLLARNGDVVLAQTQTCGACSPQIHISPGSPLAGWPGGISGEPVGALLYLLRSSASNAWFDLRIRDLSRESDEWGTELPVVRERDLFTDELLLVDVPVDGRFRQNLRIYDVDNHHDTVFHVVISDFPSDIRIAERDITARFRTPDFDPSGFPAVPAVGEITDFRATFPEIANSDRVTIQVKSLKLGVRFWAFVTLTNNQTQSVTTITPQH